VLTRQLLVDVCHSASEDETSAGVCVDANVTVAHDADAGCWNITGYVKNHGSLSGRSVVNDGGVNVYFAAVVHSNCDKVGFGA
jgi:hypothetical protein